jgi:hypothetical protein
LFGQIGEAKALCFTSGLQLREHLPQRVEDRHALVVALD